MASEILASGRVAEAGPQRAGRDLNETLRRSAVLGSPVFLVFAAILWWPNGDLLDRFGYYIGRDFMYLWTAGRLTLEGRANEIYDLAAYHAAVKAWFSPTHPFVNFSYPPSLIALLAPTAALPYLPAMVLWIALGFGAFVLAAHGSGGRRWDWTLVALLAMSPIVLLNGVIAQSGGFLALLFVAGLRLVPVKPVLGGVLIGLLTVKPHLGLLLPVALLIAGAWRTIAAAAFTALALVLASFVAWGPQAWSDYITHTLPLQQRYLEVPDGPVSWLMATPYDALWLLGVPVKPALVGHALLALPIAAAVIAVQFGKAPWSLKVATLAVGAVLLPPYSLAYDMAIVVAALVWHLSTRTQALSKLQMGVYALAIALPGLLIPFQMAHVPIGFMVLSATLAMLFREAVAAGGIGLTAGSSSGRVMLGAGSPGRPAS